jgi:hypothetical protein
MSNPNELPKPKRSVKAFYIVFFILLIGANVYLYITNRSTQSDLTNITTQKDSLETEYNNLTRSYKKTLAELEEEKGKNSALDSLVRVKQFALDEKRKEFEQIKMSDLSKEEKIAKMKDLIEQINKEKESLTKEVAEWKQKYEVVSRKLDTVSTDLASSKKQVNGLQEENKNLSSVASVLHISQVSVNGAKDKGKGEEKMTNNVKHLDYLRIAFFVEKNVVAQSGTSQIYYRISTPENKLLYNPNKGGGIMTSKEDGSEIRYTGKIEFDYQNQRTPISFKYTPDAKLEKGNYVVEFYNNGVSIGTAKFALTSSLF